MNALLSIPMIKCSLSLISLLFPLIALAEPVSPTPSPEASPGAQASQAVTPSKSVENAVVKVFSTLRAPDPTKPWSKQSPSEITGSGAVIGGKRILTNAHVILYASEVQIQANQAGDKISAHVESVAPGIDLAVLKLDDEKFFDSHPPLRLRKNLPDAKDAVMVYGYPTGGTSLSITKGIISRIEFTGYHISTPGLRIQIDAAINPGNSGGPLIDLSGKLVGVSSAKMAFTPQGVPTQGLGFAIPAETVRTAVIQFKQTAQNQPPAKTKPDENENPASNAGRLFGMQLQNLTPDLTDALGYAPGKGVLVSAVDPDGPADRAGIERGLVIYRVGKYNVTSVKQVESLLARASPGTVVDFTVGIVRANGQGQRVETVPLTAR
jgi:S1-C subfamily serine protease